MQAYRREQAPADNIRPYLAFIRKLWYNTNSQNKF